MIVVQPSHSTLQTMHVAVSTIQRRLAPAALGLLQVLDEFLFFASSSKSLASKDLAEVSTVARAVILLLESNSTAILIITIRRLLSPRSFTRPLIGFPYGQLSAAQRKRSGLPRSVLITGSFRSRLYAGGHLSTMQDWKACIPATYLLVTACQPLSLFLRDDAYAAIQIP